MDFDFEKAVSHAHATAAGWVINTHNHSSPFECHVVYLCDYRTGHIQMLTIKQSDFNQCTPPVFMNAEHFAGGIGRYMLSMANGGKPGLADEEVPLVMIGYIKNTQTFRVWRQQAQVDDRLHVIINLYPLTSDDDNAIVRPMIMPSDDSTLASELVIDLSTNIMAMDRANHPEWFPAIN